MEVKIEVDVKGMSYLEAKTNLPDYCNYRTLDIENYINDNVIGVIRSVFPFMKRIDLHIYKTEIVPLDFHSDIVKPAEISIEMSTHVCDNISAPNVQVERFIKSLAENIIKSTLNAILDMVIKFLLDNVDRNKVLEDMRKIFKKYKITPTWAYIDVLTDLVAKELNVPEIAAKEFIFIALEDSEIHKIVEETLLEKIAKQGVKIKKVTIWEYGDDAEIETDKGSIFVLRSIAEKIAKEHGVQIDYIE